jgi:branched-chain amino acid transport system substrate-binding protein
LRELLVLCLRPWLRCSGTFVTAITIFERLNIKPHFLFIEQRLALEKLKNGEIDAVIAVEGKPLQEIAQIAGENLRLVPVNYEKALQADYLPTQLTAEDYPNLIAAGQSVDTVAASAVLAAYNWAPHTDRYRRLSLFVEAFFSKVKALQRPPFHPKAGSSAECLAPGLDPVSASPGVAKPQQGDGAA